MGSLRIHLVPSNPSVRAMAPRAVQTIKVYSSPPADVKYVEVGPIQVDFGMINTEGSREKVLAKAAEIGCDVGLNQMGAATCIQFDKS